MEAAPVVTYFGKYRLIASLARGGMARVYLALMGGPGGFNKLLVLKVLRGGVLGESPEAVHMFMNEARLAARIVHQNVVHTYEVGAIEGRHFLAMEYVEGQTYRTLQTRAGKDGLPLHEELRVLSELARGLHCLHELTNFDDEPLHAVHRDVSPQNVLIGYDGQVKLLDFGIAKTAESAHWTQAGVIKGKIDYIAPEQLRGERVDRRADVFALGVMLWEALAGQRFAGGAGVSEAAKGQARLTGGEAKLRTVNPGVAEPLAAIVDKAIALKPEERFADAAAFADALDAQIEASGRRASAKSLALLMSSLFEVDRSKLRKLVEQQLESAKQSGYEPSADATGALPSLELTQSSAWSLAPAARPDASSPQPTRATTDRPVWEQATRKIRPASWGVMAVMVLLGAAAAWFTPSEAAKPLTAAPPPGAQMAEETGAVPALASSTNQESLPPSTQAPSAGEPGETAKVRLTLNAVPETAQVTLDGVGVVMPFNGELPRDNALHDLRATAKGYLPFRLLVGFDRDRELQITLVKALAKPLARRPLAPVKATEAPAAAPAVDTHDPYMRPPKR